MSVEVINISKSYGPQLAVDRVSFSVGEGEIVGFLGPNGAGKSTTMKMITGYIPPSGGSVFVAGHSVVDNPMAVKISTGYLPEHNPLYVDMYVHEYLHFMANLHGLASSLKKDRIKEVIRMCGISDEQNKKIGMLSKGFRQRVGLAQALIHDPRVLILDEPTSGLDPNQLIEIRKLIKAVSVNKTVLFSTHILQEVVALCNRVIVINRGKIVADDQLEHLLQRGGNHLVVEFASEPSESGLQALEGVIEVRRLERFRFRLETKEGTDVRPLLFKFASENSLSLLELKQEEGSLESVFGKLTGIETQDDDPDLLQRA